MRIGDALTAAEAQECLGLSHYEAGRTADALRCFTRNYDILKDMDSTQTESKIRAIAHIANANHQCRSFREALNWAHRIPSIIQDDIEKFDLGSFR